MKRAHLKKHLRYMQNSFFSEECGYRLSVFMASWIRDVSRYVQSQTNASERSTRGYSYDVTFHHSVTPSAFQEEL